METRLKFRKIKFSNREKMDLILCTIAAISMSLAIVIRTPAVWKSAVLAASAISTSVAARGWNYRNPRVGKIPMSMPGAKESTGSGRPGSLCIQSN